MYDYDSDGSNGKLKNGEMRHFKRTTKSAIPLVGCLLLNAIRAGTSMEIGILSADE